MSEALEKVRGVRELALFPLPLVQFPGVPLPLHIFEPRYRRMLDDVRAAGHNMFGVSYHDAAEHAPDERPPAGHVGCATEIVEVQPMPDGRSNVMTLGLARYRVEAYDEGAGEPYLVARVEFFEDEEEESNGSVEKHAAAVLELFTRIARAVRAINDERASLPELPEAPPERLSFLVAAAMEMEPAAKQELLEMRSTSERLRRIEGLLQTVVGNYEERARTHKVAKGNGHGGKHIDLPS